MRRPNPDEAHTVGLVLMFLRRDAGLTLRASPPGITSRRLFADGRSRSFNGHKFNLLSGLARSASRSYP